MAHEEQLEGGAESGQNGISRRKLIVTGATLAAAGVAVGAAIPLTTSAIHDHTSASGASGPLPEEPVMAYVKDGRTLDVFVGTRRVSITEPDIAARLARAAKDAT